MILDQVLQRKLQVISMDDTLRIALLKLRELDRVYSPIIVSSQEGDSDDILQILGPNENSDLFIRVGQETLP